jgi:hypothetical protein
MLNQKPMLFAALLLIISSCKCSVKTKLNETDLKWTNVYKEGDTLIFQSNNGEYDTSVIVKKQTYYNDYNPIEVSKYQEQVAVVWYKNKHLVYHPDGYRLVEVTKNSPGKNASLAIDYLYSDVLYSSNHRDSIKKVKAGKVYRFDTYNARSKSWQPKEIIWHEDFGVIEYTTHGGDVWKRINIPAAK